MGLKLKVVFSKVSDARFISHLDLVRLFQRAARRSGMPVTMTRGFSPRLKISITRALRLGVESLSEEAIFCMDKDIEPGRFMDAVNAKLPDGVKILNAEEMN